MQFLLAVLLAGASPSPSPTILPAPTPTASPVARGVRISADAFSTLIDQATSGPGTTPFEAAAYLNGNPAAPVTPFDLISTNPQMPGVAGHAQLHAVATANVGHYIASLEVGAAYLRGSVMQTAYWGEPIMPTLNPHIGARAFDEPLVFPTHAGQDDVAASRASVLSGTLQSQNGNVRVQAGWLNLGQTDGFVFNQAANPTLVPGLAPQIAESAGNGTPSNDAWQSTTSSLPLNGIDAQMRSGLFSAELSDVSLPSPVARPARARIASLFFNKNDKLGASAEVARVTTDGDPVVAAVYFGSNASITATTQGNLPLSTVGAQMTTIAGVRAWNHDFYGLDAIAEIGRSTYSATDIKEPNRPVAGGFYHGGFAKTFRRATAGVDWYRFDPNYATAYVPYGITENQWTPAFAWPGQWVKSTYQLVDNSLIGVNREGYRLHYFVDGGPLEVHVAYMNYRQVTPSTYATASEPGFVDALFQPQSSTFGNRAELRRYNFWVAWHPKFADVTLDVVEDTLHRTAPISHPEDAVSYDAPEAVLTVSRTLSKRTTIAAGMARYGMLGSFALGGATNLDYAQRTEFVGAQFGLTEHAGTLVELRHFDYAGRPITPGTGDTSFEGTLLVVEQRFKI